MNSVQLPRSLWDAFKSKFADFPLEVQNCLLDHIEMKVGRSEQKPVISMLWNWQFCDIIYTAALQLDIEYRNDVRHVVGIQGWLYTLDAPQGFDVGEP